MSPERAASCSRAELYAWGTARWARWGGALHPTMAKQPQSIAIADENRSSAALRLFISSPLRCRRSQDRAKRGKSRWSRAHCAKHGYDTQLAFSGPTRMIELRTL